MRVRRGLGPGGWVACEYPERPYENRRTAFHNRPCRACLIAAEMVLNRMNPLTTDPDNMAAWHEMIAVLAGER